MRPAAAAGSRLTSGGARPLLSHPGQRRGGPHVRAGIPRQLMFTGSSRLSAISLVAVISPTAQWPPSTDLTPTRGRHKTSRRPGRRSGTGPRGATRVAVPGVERAAGAGCERFMVSVRSVRSTAGWSKRCSRRRLCQRRSLAAVGPVPHRTALVPVPSAAPSHRGLPKVGLAIGKRRFGAAKFS
jgi:hypothetical protein